MAFDFWSVALAYLVAGLVTVLGVGAGALSRSGAVAACLVGGTILGFGGPAWAALLVVFFVSSSTLSFFKAGDARKKRAAETFEKGGRRDAAQVLANGGVAAALALVSPFASDLSVFVAFAGALAAATADTWATEVGVLSRQTPRLVTTGREVEAGTSGAVTLAGSSAAVAGALLIALAAVFLILTGGLTTDVGAMPIDVALATLAGGVAGSFADSLLGATVQAGYQCPQCDKATESRVHRCGSQTRLITGLRWIGNDLVNLIATAVGALVAGVLS